MAFRIAFDRQQVTYLGFLGLCPVGFQLLGEFCGQSSAVCVDRQPSWAGEGTERRTGVWTLVYELPFSSLACVTCPNWGVVGGKPAPGTTFRSLAPIVGIFRYQGKAETGDWGTGKERGRRSAARWAHVQWF